MAGVIMNLEATKPSNSTAWAGMATSIISNGSLITREWMQVRVQGLGFRVYDGLRGDG